jgi:hypothetical protein
MYTSQLFIMLSALVATSQAAPSHPPAESVVIDTPTMVSYAGAPANGEYPDEVAGNGGWESDAPTYDTAVSLYSGFEPKFKADVTGGNCRMVCYYRNLPFTGWMKLIISLQMDLMLLPSMDLDQCPLQT